MEAPDKLYVVPMKTESQDAFVGLAYELDMLLVGKTEYIRKDIVDETIKTAEDHAYFAGQEKFREKLIEWVKEKLEGLKGLLDTDPYKDGYIGQCEAYKELIDKWNLM